MSRYSYKGRSNFSPTLDLTTEELIRRFNDKYLSNEKKKKRNIQRIQEKTIIQPQEKKRKE